MDPASIFGVVTGAIGLIPLCASGFEFVIHISQAKEKFDSIAEVLDIHETTFRQWRRGLHIDNLTGYKAVEAFRRNVPDIQQEFVLKYLVRLSNLFAKNAEGYSKYGIKQTDNQSLSEIKELPIQPQDWQFSYNEYISERKSQMDLLRRAKFVLRDAKKFENFSDQIGRYLGQLLQTMTYFHVQAMNLGMISAIVSDRHPYTAYGKEHHSTSALIKQMKQLRSSSCNPIQQCQFDLVRTTAEFADMVRAATQQPFVCLVDRFSRSSPSDPGNWSIMSNKVEIGTMVIGTRINPINVYYIEWKQYGNNKGQPDETLRSHIEALSKVASIPRPSPDFRVLPCLGTIHEPGKMRYGLVYALPLHVQNISATSVPYGEVSHRRKPTSLAYLLEDPEEMPLDLDLGNRIEVIKKVAQSLFLLHAVGWVHKNICSDSIIFFPARSSQDSSFPSPSDQLDYTNPYLCGFGQSRPDIINNEPNSDRSVRQRESGRASKSVAYGVDPKALFEENKHQHPFKRLNPERPYIPCFDVYSLGVVMLEIGLWEPVSELVTDNDLEESRHELIGLAVEDLRRKTGKLFANATRRCLAIKWSDSPQRGRETLQKTIEDLSRVVV